MYKYVLQLQYTILIHVPKFIVINKYIIFYTLKYSIINYVSQFNGA